MTGQRLGTPAAGVHDDEQGPGRQVRGRRLDEGDRLLACFGGRFQHHHPLVGEQRGAEQLGELGGADLTGAHAVHRDVVGARLLACGAQDIGHGALDQKFFVPKDQVQSGD